MKTTAWKVAIEANPKLVQEYAFNFFPLFSSSLKLQKECVGHSINEMYQQHSLLIIKQCLVPGIY